MISIKLKKPQFFKSFFKELSVIFMVRTLAVNHWSILPVSSGNSDLKLEYIVLAATLVSLSLRFVWASITYLDSPVQFRCDTVGLHSRNRNTVYFCFSFVER